ncbi:unnamed protein product [Rhizophagus irregularis]|nr:unnamed protein product [Rhizophagus irregularis]
METNVSYNFFVRLCIFDFENEMVFLVYLTWKRKGSISRSLEIRKTTSECFGFWMIMGFRSTNHWEFVMGTV